MLVGNFRGTRMSFSPKKSLWTLPLTMTISNQGGILLPDGKTDCLRRHLSVSSKFKVSLLSFSTCTLRQESPFFHQTFLGKVKIVDGVIFEVSKWDEQWSSHPHRVHLLRAFSHCYSVLPGHWSLHPLWQLPFISPTICAHGLRSWVPSPFPACSP